MKLRAKFLFIPILLFVSSVFLGACQKAAVPSASVPAKAAALTRTQIPQKEVSTKSVTKQAAVPTKPTPQALAPEVHQAKPEIAKAAAVPPIEVAEATTVQATAQGAVDPSPIEIEAANAPPPVAVPSSNRLDAEPNVQPSESLPPTPQIEVVQSPNLAPTETETSAPPTPTPTPTPDTRVKLEGTMSIEFSSRGFTEEEMREKPERIYDRYSLNLFIPGATKSDPNVLRVKGEVFRYAQVLSKYLGSEVQPLSLDYNLTFAAPVADKERSVGTWKGKITRTPAGLYQLGRADSLQAQAVKDLPLSRGGTFSGGIQGKNPDADTSVAGTLREYARMLRGRKVSYTAKRVDPLEFKSTTIPAGPFEEYPAVAVHGNLDYDYDTGNWLTNGLTFRYRLNGKDISDKITGSIRWLEDPNRSENGKGQYEFNLRFNEEHFNGRGGEEEYFENASDEEQFFVVDSRVPTISGVIKYKDTFSTPAEGEDPTVMASSIYYQLVGEGVRVDQMVSFLKLWLLIVGPVNDE